MNTKVIMFQFLHEVSLIVPKKVYYEQCSETESRLIFGTSLFFVSYFLFSPVIECK